MCPLVQVYYHCQKISPPYKVSTNITKLVQDSQHVAPIQDRMVHGIMEIFEQEHEGVRWLIMGGDDSIFFLENIVDVLGKYDHNKYYYFGASSKCILSNFWDSFNQGYGGAGFIMSFPLAKSLANDIESCLRRYPFLKYAHHITMACIVDLGVSFSHLKVDIRCTIWIFQKYYHIYIKLSINIYLYHYAFLFLH